MTLDWPPGWERTPANRRKDGRFSQPKYGTHGREPVPIGLAEALRRVQQQVRALRGTDLRIDTAHRAEDYRLDGQLRAKARVPDDPGVVVRFRIHGEPREMAMDTYRRIEDNLAAVAAIIDAKRTAIRHGGATAEREFQGYAALPATAGQSAPPGAALVRAQWDALLSSGVPRSAAYRQLAKIHHPDRGGNADAFHELTHLHQATGGGSA